MIWERFTKNVFGNGVFLYKLAKNGYINLYGIDYSIS